MSVNDEFARIWKEAVVISFNVLITVWRYWGKTWKLETEFFSECMYVHPFAYILICLFKPQGLISFMCGTVSVYNCTAVPKIGILKAEHALH